MKKVLTLLLSLNVLFLFAQRSITGTVISSLGEPLIGASVVVKGTTHGCETDIDGKYYVCIPRNLSTLVVSFVGMETKEVQVGVSNQVDVTLQSDDVLPEFVVTAAGIKSNPRERGGCGSVWTLVLVNAEYTSYSEKSTIKIDVLKNPFSDQVALDVHSDNQEKASITLRNIEGKTLRSSKIELEKGSNRVVLENVNDLITGTYIVSIDIEDTSESQVIVSESELKLVGSNMFSLITKHKLDSYKYETTKDDRRIKIKIDKSEYNYFNRQDDLRRKIAGIQKTFFDSHIGNHWRNDNPEAYHQCFTNDILPLIANYRDIFNTDREVSDFEYFDDEFGYMFRRDYTVGDWNAYNLLDWIYIKEKQVIRKKKVYSQVIVKM